MLGTMSVDDLRLVLAVAEHGSFVAAATVTRVPTSTVSRVVARFEEQMGVRLFQRTSRRVAVTDEGARLVARAAPLLAELDAVVEDAQGAAHTVSGRVRVSAPVATGAGPIAAALYAFAEAYPQVQVELSLSNQVVDLVGEGFDVAFRGGPVEGADLVVQRLHAVEFGLGATSGFVAQVLGRRRRLDRERLERLPAIVSRPDELWRFRGEGGALRDVHPRARFCVNDPRVAVEAAQRGFAIVRAPLERLHAAGLVVLEPAAELGTLLPRELFAVTPSRRMLPRRVRLAIDWVAEALARSRPPPRRAATPARPPDR
jgi:LysR family transcriptional regulator AphB